MAKNSVKQLPQCPGAMQAQFECFLLSHFVTHLVLLHWNLSILTYISFIHEMKGWTSSMKRKINQNTKNKISNTFKKLTKAVFFLQILFNGM